jgi:hypothetical protein
LTIAALHNRKAGQYGSAFLLCFFQKGSGWEAAKEESCSTEFQLLTHIHLNRSKEKKATHGWPSRVGKKLISKYIIISYLSGLTVKTKNSGSCFYRGLFYFLGSPLIGKNRAKVV